MLKYSKITVCSKNGQTLMLIFHDSIFYKPEVRTILQEGGIVLGLLKKKLLKNSKIVLMYSNSLARHFSPMFHTKCLLPVRN